MVCPLMKYNKLVLDNNDLIFDSLNNYIIAHYKCFLESVMYS